jgi:ABC-type amino acid transport substrate-binding protein
LDQYSKTTFLNFTGRNFSDVNSILQAVEDGVVDGALIDKLTGARLDALRDPSSVLVVKSIIPQSWTYGIFMTGHAVKLHKQFRKYLRNNAQLVTGLIKNYTQPLKVSGGGLQ